MHILKNFRAFPARDKCIKSAMIVVGAICLAGIFPVTAPAQQPTQEQRNAIKAACRSDFISHCGGVTPGGKDALVCLQQHDASLSQACRSAISALDTKPTPTAATTPQSPVPSATTAATGSSSVTPAERDAVKSACRSDFMAQCPGVAPGGAAALSCLQQHADNLSPPCQQAVAALSGGSGTMTAPVVARPSPAMPSFTPREELIVMRRSCGPDFRMLCRAVPLGGGRGISCLRDNFARVSPGCQRVLTHGL